MLMLLQKYILEQTTKVCHKIQIFQFRKAPYVHFQQFHSFEWGAEYFWQVETHLLTNNENRIARLLPDVFHFFLSSTCFLFISLLFHVPLPEN